MAFLSVCMSFVWLSHFIDTFRPVDGRGGNDRMSWGFLLLYLFYTAAFEILTRKPIRCWINCAQYRGSYGLSLHLLLVNSSSEQCALITLAYRLRKVWILTYWSDLLAPCKYFWVILGFFQSCSWHFHINHILSLSYIVRWPMRISVDLSQYRLPVSWSGKPYKKICVASLEVGISWSMYRREFFHGKFVLWNGRKFVGFSL